MGWKFDETQEMQMVDGIRNTYTVYRHTYIVLHYIQKYRYRHRLEIRTEMRMPYRLIKLDPLRPGLTQVIILAGVDVDFNDAWWFSTWCYFIQYKRCSDNRCQKRKFFDWKTGSFSIHFDHPLLKFINDSWLLFYLLLLICTIYNILCIFCY